MKMFFDVAVIIAGIIALVLLARWALGYEKPMMWFLYIMTFWGLIITICQALHSALGGER